MNKDENKTPQGRAITAAIDFHNQNSDYKLTSVEIAREIWKESKQPQTNWQHLLTTNKSIRLEWILVICDMTGVNPTQLLQFFEYYEKEAQKELINAL